MTTTKAMNQGFIAYLRVSTTRQGTGTSLTEQRHAISSYASTRGLHIHSWRTEVQTAANTKRSVFREVMKELTAGVSNGLIVHRIDRGARNLKDWAELGELIDQGVDVRFVHDDLDLHSRGGRLAADIQAVVAADYIRNLRDETCKGMRGRFRQGLYPLPAPLGYLDSGGGKPKRLHPEKCSLIQHTFEMYAAGDHSLRTLVLEMERQGLRNHQDQPVSLGGMSRILNNRFYVGLTHLRHTGETFVGIHEPLVSRERFDQVQNILRSRRGRAVRLKHNFLFRRLLRCLTCGRFLIGEIHKGHTYYRCHQKECRTSLREECVTESIRSSLLLMRPEIAWPDAGDLRLFVEQFIDICTVHQKQISVALRHPTLVPEVPDVYKVRVP